MVFEYLEGSGTIDSSRARSRFLNDQEATIDQIQGGMWAEYIGSFDMKRNFIMGSQCFSAKKKVRIFDMR